MFFMMDLALISGWLVSFFFATMISNMPGRVKTFQQASDITNGATTFSITTLGITTNKKRHLA
jgi:hypothetical protein